MDTLRAYFDCYGVRLVLESGSAELVDAITRDFEYFAVPDAGGAAAGAPSTTGGATAARRADGPIVIRAHLAAAPWDRIPSQLAAMHTPSTITYDVGNVRTNDYNRRALAVYDFGRDDGEVWSEDPDLLYEVVYLMALSRVGERHDLRGIHRLHALGVTIGDRAALVLLPEGGGKSTLAMELLARPEIGILSDDTPLIAGDRLLAFPTRIGMRGGADGVDPRHLRIIRRRDRAPKTVIGLDWFRSRVVAEASPAALIIGVRHGGPRSWIEPLAPRRAFPAVAANLIFGLGLPQVVEYFLRGGAGDMLRKSAIMRSRLFAAVRLLRRARCYRLVMGRDVEASASAVASVLQPDATPER